MIERLKGINGTTLANLYRLIRSRWWSSLLLDGAMVLTLFWGITAWQTRDLLPGGAQVPAPGFELTALDGQSYRLDEARGTPVLLYFFAPWCGVCNLSAHNLEDLRQARGEAELVIYLVAISYSNVASVQDYADRHQLSMPILLGDERIVRDYRIAATPTYYVIDSQGRIKDRTVGYSSELGLRWRTPGFF